MTDAAQWQGNVGQAWAEEWRRTDRSFATLTDRLLMEQRGATITHGLDIGCGAGEISLAMARAHADAKIVGIDISSDLIAVARDRAGRLGNAEFLLADAAVWRPSHDARPDFLVSRHGVMFFEEPVDAFVNLHKGAQAGAKLAFSCFAEVQKNGWVLSLMKLLPDIPSASNEYQPGPFAFGDRSRVETILGKSGWQDIRIEPFDYPMVFGSGDNAVNDATEYFGRIGPIARHLAQLDDERRANSIDKLTQLVHDNCSDGLVAMPASAWIVTACA